MQRAAVAGPLSGLRGRATDALAARKGARGRYGPVSGLVRLLSSVRLALVLILVIAALVLIGTVVSQVPATMAADPAAYAAWLAKAQTHYGVLTGPMERLQLFNVFHSLLFRFLLGLLAASIVVCTASRWRPTWKTVFGTRVRASETFITHAHFNSRVETPLGLTDAAARLRGSLRRARYSVRLDEQEGSIALFADKNGFSRFGTFLTHLSLVLILAAAIAGGMWGFKDPQFVVAEGQTRDLGMGTGLALQLDHFSANYYADGRAKDYASEVTLLKDGKPVKDATIRVNSPLRYGGVAFHQSFFGQAAVMKVQDASGRTLFDGDVALPLVTGDAGRPVGGFDLPGQDLTVYVVAPRPDGTDPAIAPGEVGIDVYRNSVRDMEPQKLTQGTPAQLEGLTFTFERESRFTGLNVVKSPGTNIIWIACGLMFVGLAMLFYLPRRRLWALCKKNPSGDVEVLIGMPGQRDSSVEFEFEKLATRASSALEARSTSLENRETEDE